MLKGISMKRNAIRTRAMFGPLLGTVITMLLILGFFILSPIVGIWAINTLFPSLAIPYTLNTWVAFVSLGGILHVICYRQ
jgi:hypothetical protein